MILYDPNSGKIILEVISVDEFGTSDEKIAF